MAAPQEYPVKITHLGTACVLLEIGSLRILTDPALDDPGKYYDLGFGCGSKKLTHPAIAADKLGKIDAVLLSHDQHADNLDDKGRELLPNVGKVLTTKAGHHRLSTHPPKLANVIGMQPWDTFELASEDGNTKIKVTAAPGRHGPPVLANAVVGEVTGFLLDWPGQKHGAIWISGDTVLYDGLWEIGKKVPKIGTVIVHLGAVQFINTAFITYTMGAADASQLIAKWNPHQVLPIHYEGWSHFSESKEKSQKAFDKGGVTSLVKWLTLGEATSIEA